MNEGKHTIRGCYVMLVVVQLPSLKLTAKAPENRWLKYDRFLLGQILPVRFRECTLEDLFHKK